jgi:hypothetical protein
MPQVRGYRVAGVVPDKCSIRLTPAGAGVGGAGGVVRMRRTYVEVFPAEKLHGGSTLRAASAQLAPQAVA